MNDCLFCKIIRGEIPSFKIYEDENHLVILDIFPVNKAQTLVLTKKHYGSKITDVSEDVLKDLMVVVRKVAENIGKKLEDVERCQVVFEGFHVDHVHAKLFPAFNPNPSKDGIIHIGEKADNEDLENLADKLNF